MARILVVEDRAIDRKFLATLFGYCGHQVIEANDGAEALDLVAANRPDLVVSDILMPTLDGYDFGVCGGSTGWHRRRWSSTPPTITSAKPARWRLSAVSPTF